MSKKSKISADDFLRMSEDENEYIKQDIAHQVSSSFSQIKHSARSPKQEENGEQTGSKRVAQPFLTIPTFEEALKPKTELRTNLGQSQDKPKTELRTNLGQSQDKPKTMHPSGVNPIQETSDKPRTEPRTQARTNLGQTSDKLRTNSSFLALVGLQRCIVLFIYEQLRVTLDKITDPISVSALSEACKTSKLSAQKTIQRLELAGIVKRLEFKNGRAGWTRYGLDERIYNDMLQNESSDKLRTNLGQSQDKPKTEPRTQPRTSLPIVVVPNSLSLKTTTTETSNGDAPCFVIPNELSGMVSRRQLAQFVLDEKISEYELQMSLDAFAFDLKNKLVSTKHTANPVGLLIGAIKNNGGYNSQKFAEALKTEMKTLLSSQQTLEDSISEAKRGEGWAKYQEIKNSSPEAFQALVAKYEKQGLKGDLLEEFGFLEFQEQESLKKTEKLNPLSP